MQPGYQARLGKFVGPYHAAALPFVLASDKGCDWSRPQHTNAYQFVRSQGGSIFITRLRWDINDVKEISRIEAIDIWVTALNWRTDVHEIRKCILAEQRSKSADLVRRRQSSILNEFMRKMQGVHVHLSGFFGDLAAIESSGRIHQEWPSRHMPPLEQHDLAKFINAAMPETTWPYLMLDGLRNMLSGASTELDLIQILATEFKISPYHVPKPTYLGWKGEEFPLSHDLGVPDSYYGVEPPSPEEPTATSDCLIT